jgi:membrane-associated phospholipid phosphatase
LDSLVIRPYCEEVDYTIDHAINHALRAHPLLDAVLAGFASWGVTLFGVAAFALWLFDRPRQAGVYRRACAAGLSAAAVGLLINQVISHAWHRARPYEAHPHGVIPLISGSHDPSFPSDHATAAFAIAFGILFVAYRAGLVFLAWATLIALSRVLVGVHYPTDVLASLGVGIVAGFLCARVLMVPLLEPLIRVAGRITDPLLEPIERAQLVRSSFGSPRVRSITVAIIGGVLFVLFAAHFSGPLLDEMPLGTLSLWALVVVGAVYLAGLQPSRRHLGLSPR